jgi:uracil DNA glycosylase
VGFGFLFPILGRNMAKFFAKSRALALRFARPSPAQRERGFVGCYQFNWQVAGLDEVNKALVAHSG